MFRKKRKRKKQKKKTTETIVTIDGWDIIICSDKPIEEGAKKKIGRYVFGIVNIEDQFDIMAALINMDFFGGLAKVQVKQKEDNTMIVKITKEPKKNLQEEKKDENFYGEKDSGYSKENLENKRKAGIWKRF